MIVSLAPAPSLNFASLRRAVRDAAAARQQMVLHRANPAVLPPTVAEFHENPDIMDAAMEALTALPQLMDRVERLHALLPAHEAQIAKEMGL